MDGKGLSPPTFTLRRLLIAVTLVCLFSAIIKNVPASYSLMLTALLLMAACHVLSTAIGSQLRSLNSAGGGPHRMRAPQDLGLPGENADAQRLGGMAEVRSYNDSKLPSHEHDKPAFVETFDDGSWRLGAGKRLVWTMFFTALIAGIVGALITLRFLWETPDSNKPFAVTVACSCGGLLSGMLGFAASGFWQIFLAGWTDSASTASSFRSYKSQSLPGKVKTKN